MKKFIFSLVAVATVFSSQAQLLWKVSGGDAKGDSYLFGTHHIAPASILDSTAGFAEALNGVSTVYGEMEMSEMTSPATQQIVMKYSMAPADSTLSKVLTPAQVDSVNSILAKYTGRYAHGCCGRHDEAGGARHPARSVSEHDRFP